jgi:serine/threonine protein kinase
LEKGNELYLFYQNRTYGQVFRAKIIKNGKIVAIKKFKESDQEDEHVREKDVVLTHRNVL